MRFVYVVRGIREGVNFIECNEDVNTATFGINTTLVTFRIIPDVDAVFGRFFVARIELLSKLIQCSC